MHKTMAEVKKTQVLYNYPANRDSFLQYYWYYRKENSKQFGNSYLLVTKQFLENNLNDPGKMGCDSEKRVDYFI